MKKYQLGFWISSSIRDTKSRKTKFATRFLSRQILTTQAAPLQALRASWNDGETPVIRKFEDGGYGMDYSYAMFSRKRKVAGGQDRKR